METKVLSSTLDTNKNRKYIVKKANSTILFVYLRIVKPRICYGTTHPLRLEA